MKKKKDSTTLKVFVLLTSVGSCIHMYVHLLIHTHAYTYVHKNMHRKTMTSVLDTF